jgi:3-dehydroquinate synthase
MGYAMKRNEGFSPTEKKEHTVVHVPLGAMSYDIIIGERVLAETGAILSDVVKCKRAIIVTDDNVASRYLHRLTGSLAAAEIRCTSFILPSGEATKSTDQLLKLVHNILSQEPDRHTAVIALGGGVIGDIAGCAASLVLRGLPFVQIPTTLLAQVDSSVGGKTGVNTSYGKNTMGSFYQPKIVLIDITTLETLPKRELLSGYAEIAKYGLIADAMFFEWLEVNANALLSGNVDLLTRAIATSCKAKAEIVAEDEREISGKRALLNFGHTFAHALEAETGYGPDLLHGEAVGVGMVLAAALSERLRLCGQRTTTRIREHLSSVGLRTSLREVREMWNINQLIAHMAHDKKAEHGALNFVLTRGIGSAEIVKNVDKELVRDIITEALQ